MSVQYRHYLVPTEVRYLPGEKALEMALNALASDGWISPDAGARRERFLRGSQIERTNLHSAARIVRDSVECIKGGFHQDIDLRPKDIVAEQDGRDDRVFWQMPKGTALSQRWCWGVSISVSADLRLIPLGENPGVLLCPRCRSDLIGQLDKQEKPSVAEVIETCQTCHERIEPNEVERIADAAVTGCPQISERAPFFRFSVSLTSDSPPEDPAATDPTILEILRSSTGVGFRALGRWF